MSSAIAASPPRPGIRSRLLFRLRRCTRLAALMAMVLLTYSASGCLSNQYVIPKQELERLVQLPPESRGQKVQVVQKIGDRRAPPVPPGGPPPGWQGPGPGPYPGESGSHYGHGHSHVYVGTTVVVPGPGYGGGGHYRGGPPPRGVTEAAPVSAAPAGGAVTPVAPMGSAGAPAQAPAPAATTAGTSGGGLRGVKPPSSGKAEEMAVWAVIAVVAASLAVFGLAFTEGARFDGYTQIAPGQLVYLQDSAGQQRPVPLGALTLADVAPATEAIIMDDEGYGLLRLDRRPLDRRGFALKLDLGMLGTESAGYDARGFAANIQVGYFPFQRFGILGGASLGFGDTPGVGTFARHMAALEAQVFPLRLGILHIGAFGHAGMQFAADPDQPSATSEPALGAGLLLELELTTRLAFTIRGGWTGAQGPAGAWRGIGYVTGGLAIY